MSARADARLIMDKARSLRQNLLDLGWPATDLPNIDKHWFGRWRREFKVSYRAVTTIFKVSFDVACRRVTNMLCNIFRLQALWELCHPGIPMRWFSMDQKPSWFNNAGLKKTFTKKGSRNVNVKENFHATRARYTIATIVMSWRPDGTPKMAILFKGKPGSAMGNGLATPEWMLIQFQEKGSYRSQDVVDLLEWALPDAEKSEDSIIVLLDWFAAHLSDEVRECVQRKG